VFVNRGVVITVEHQFATLICALVVIYLFKVDLKESRGHSAALWIPQIWMVLATSRSISRWFDSGSSAESHDDYLDGSPIDRAVFFVLIIIGLAILGRRKIKWVELIEKNIWIWPFFIFGAVSIVWSDYPLVSSKRWIKACGNVIMVLIVLTEDRPYEAFGAILRRTAILLIPVSVLLIKYYPALGRGYHMGLPMYTGVADQKNGLGVICLLSGIYFFWAIALKGGRARSVLSSKVPLPLLICLVPMIAWLFYMANSATATVCMFIAGGLCMLGKLSMFQSAPRRVLMVLLWGAVFIGLVEYLFDIKSDALAFLGRDSSLTTRVPMWESLIAMAGSPIAGAGFEIFWTGERRVVLQEMWGGLIQAHNGYLEVYLNLGVIGVLCVLLWFWAGFRGVIKSLITDYPNSMLRLCLIVVAGVYNWTEAAFFGVNGMWVALLVGTIEPITKTKRLQSPLLRKVA